MRGEEAGRGQSRGPDIVFGHGDPGGLQACGEITLGEDRIVRQNEEGEFAFAKRIDELRGTRQSLLLVDEDTVHVGQPILDRAHGCSLRGASPSSG